MSLLTGNKLLYLAAGLMTVGCGAALAGEPRITVALIGASLALMWLNAEKGN